MKDWEERALHFLRTSEMSYRDIGNMVSRSRDTILALARNHKVNRPVKQKGRKALEDMERPSVLHTSIGLQLTLLRGAKSITEMANELRISPYLLRNMEYGVHDFTLTQLQQIAVALGLSIEQLVKPRS